MYQKEEYSKNRRKVLLALFKQPMDYTALKDETKLSDPTLSKHLRDLMDSNLIEFKREGRRKVYKLKELALNTPELVCHLAGINAALKLIKGEDFKRCISEVISFGKEATKSFFEVISRISDVKEVKLDGNRIYNEILSVMQSDYEKLKNLDEANYQRVVDELNSMYFALGPPFSYKWKNMVETLEYKKI